jgi:hypothetical protein
MDDATAMPPPQKKRIYGEIDAHLFLTLGLEMMRRPVNETGARGSHGTELRRFHSCFGAHPKVVSSVWDLIDPFHTPIYDYDGVLLPNPKPEHLLWACMFLKLYTTESINATMAAGFSTAVDEKTFRKWSWAFIHHIAELESDLVSLKLVVVVVCHHFDTFNDTVAVASS